MYIKPSFIANTESRERTRRRPSHPVCLLGMRPRSLVCLKPFSFAHFSLPPSLLPWVFASPRDDTNTLACRLPLLLLRNGQPGHVWLTRHQLLAEHVQ